MCVDCLPAVSISKTQCTPENLISELSHRPRWLLDGGIRVPLAPGFSSTRRNSDTSSLGCLSKLPLELLHLVCNSLDFQSLSRLSRVSIGGKIVLESFRPYRAIMSHAPQSLRALGKTLLIQYHTAATLYAAITSQNCASCGEYGPFLFLPTCQRCCYECLHNNQSLWVVPKALAKKCFHLAPQHLREIPTMRSIPGKYRIGHGITRRRPLRLVSVRAAKMAAITVHGTIDILDDRDSSYTNQEVKDFDFFTFLRNAPLEPLGNNPSRMPTRGDPVSDDYCGMASIFFPSLSPSGVLEEGLWCRGCELIFDRFGTRGAYSYPDLTPPGVDPYWVAMGMARQAWSKSEFLRHVICCPGVRYIIPALQESIEDC